ncbi:MAG: hypothetical protein WDO19_30130 [Bacteroidota bacterium]
MIGQFTPVIADKIELGLGLGAGYRFALYPSSPLSGMGVTGKKDRHLKELFRHLFS